MTEAGDLSGRVCMITGATGALGRAASIEFARRRATTVLVARNPSRGSTAAAEIRRLTGTESIEVLVGDLTSMASVRAIAQSFINRHARLHVLVHTAAVYCRDRATTADGLERMFATNYLGPFLLTNLLLPALRSGAPSRVIVVSAPSTTKLDFADLQGEKAFRPLQAFGASKSADLLITYELARRLQGTGVTVNAVHPGLMKSELMRELSAPARGFVRLFSKPPERAAESVLHLATSPDLDRVTGRFFKGTKPAESSAYSRDPEIQRQLWAESERLVGETFP